MNTAQHIKADGEITSVTPANGEHFTLEELQGFVGGMIEMTHLPTGEQFWTNEDGRGEGLPPNPVATAIWRRAFRGCEPRFIAEQDIVGDVLVCDPSLTK